MPLLPRLEAGRREQLADRRERLEVIELMPRTATGKIQKFVLRETAKKLAPEGGAAVNF